MLLHYCQMRTCAAYPVSKHQRASKDYAPFHFVFLGEGSHIHVEGDKGDDCTYHGGLGDHGDEDTCEKATWTYRHIEDVLLGRFLVLVVACADVDKVVVESLA